ncbi:MAG: metal ABC transporter ATP-binding protein [Desulfurococcaceae archaeon]
MKVIIEALTIKRGSKIVISNLSASMEGPGLYQVIGPNGSGKTTLMLTILGVIKPTSGSIRVELNNRNHNGPIFSYMPQSYSIPKDAPITVYEFVKGYYELSKPWPRFLHRDISVDEKIRRALELVNIPKSMWMEQLRNLSGGMLQRVFLARTLVIDAPMILLDEPLSNIDPDGKVDIAELLGELSRGKLIITTSHDPILLLDYTKKILLLGYGFHAYGDVNEILKYEILSKFYKKCAVELDKHVHIVDWH